MQDTRGSSPARPEHRGLLSTLAGALGRRAARIFPFLRQRRAAVTPALPPPRSWQPRSAVMLVPDDRIDRRVLLEARSLVRAGWRVTVVGAPPPFPGYTHDEESFPEVEILRVDASRAQAVPDELRSPVHPPGETDWVDFYWLTNHYYLLGASRPSQVVVAHDLPVLPAAIMAAARHGALLVYDAHELYPEQHHFGPAWIERYRKAETSIAKLADRVITVNQSIAREMVTRYGVAAPEVILNCPDVTPSALPTASGNELRQELQIPARQRILLFQGGMSLNRNLEALVAAMGHVQRDDVVLVLMGPGNEKRRELEGIARDARTLGRRVFFRDAVAQKDLLRYCRSADAGMIPYPHIDLNSYYCTPNKLFDFLVVGLPILANDSPELRRFVAEQGVGMVHPMTDARAIAAGIDMFFSGDLAAYRIRLRDVGSRFTWEHEGDLVVRIYEDLITRGARDWARVEDPDNR
ncbi:MAG: glycosyltransferase [Planctomycetota bacterium]